MIKNVTVLSSEGKMIGVTYPKRALGLVKKGRARYLDGDETVIVLASSPEDIMSQEDNMNNNFNFDEFIEKAKATAKVAGEGVSELADKSAAKIDEALKKLTAALRKIEDTTEEVRAEAGAEAEPAEEAEEFGEVLCEADLEELIDKVDDEAMRAKIRATVEREKTRRERAQRVEEIERKVREKAKDAFEDVSTASRDIAAWSRQVAKDAKTYVEVKVAEAKTKMSEREAAYKEQARKLEDACKKMAAEPAPELTIDGMLYEIRRIERDTEHIQRAIESVHSIEVGAPGDIGAQAKANAILDIVQVREETNRKLLEKHFAILSHLAEEEEKKKAKEEESRQIAYLEAENAEKLSILEDLLDTICDTDPETNKNKLAFYMKTARMMVEKDPSLITTDIVESVLETVDELDEETDKDKLAFFMSLIG